MTRPDSVHQATDERRIVLPERAGIRKTVRALAICWAMIPPLWLMAYWADVGHSLRTIALVAYWIILLGGTVAASMVVVATRRTRHLHRSGSKRSGFVMLAYVISALVCSLLPYKGIAPTNVEAFDGIFKNVVYEKHRYIFVFSVGDEVKRCALEYRLAEEVKKQLTVGEPVHVQVHQQQVWQLAAHGVEVISMERTQNTERKFGMKVGATLLGFTFLYWLANPRVRDATANS